MSMKKEYVIKAAFKFLRNSFIILLILFVVDRSLGTFLEHFLFAEKQGDSSITTHAVLNSHEEIVIFGSSRAGHHYIPKLIEKNTGLSCYNFGRDGTNILYYESLLKIILSSSTPKVAILDLNLDDFMEKKNQKKVILSILLPYINENKVVEDLVYEGDKIEFFKSKISKLYRYNSLPIPILLHHLSIGQKHYQGYEPLNGCKIKNQKKKLIDNPYNETRPELQAFENFVKTAHENNIKLFVVISPSFKRFKNNALKTANEILAKYGSKCHNYSEFITIQNKNHFYDGSHLNNTGAEIFTKQLIADHLLETTTSESKTAYNHPQATKHNK